MKTTKYLDYKTGDVWNVGIFVQELSQDIETIRSSLNIITQLLLSMPTDSRTREALWAIQDKLEEK